MATSYTRNLRLRLTDTLSSDSRYNLEKLDLLGATVQTNSTSATYLRSRLSLTLEPNAPLLGGSGIGGEINLGQEGQAVESLSIHADRINCNAPIGLLDSGTGGSKYLRIRYKSDIGGSTDTSADRQLSIDLDGADRDIQITTSGVLVTDTGTQTITGKTFDYTQNTFLNFPGVSSSVQGNASIWAIGDGVSKTVTHNLGTQNVHVMIIDNSGQQINVDNINITSNNTVSLTASEIPSGNWTVVTLAIA